MVSYSWFPFLGTRGEHTWVSRATKNSWKNDSEGESELERSGAFNETICMILLSTKERVFEHPKVLIRKSILTDDVVKRLNNTIVVVSLCELGLVDVIQKLFVTLVTEVSLISREPNHRFERISLSRRFLWKSFSSFFPSSLSTSLFTVSQVPLICH